MLFTALHQYDHEQIQMELRRYLQDLGLEEAVLDTALNENVTVGSVVNGLTGRLITLAAEEDRRKFREKQSEGIARAQKAGVAIGRPTRKQDKRFRKVKDMYLAQEVTGQEAARRCAEHVLPLAAPGEHGRQVTEKIAISLTGTRGVPAGGFRAWAGPAFLRWLDAGEICCAALFPCSNLGFCGTLKAYHPISGDPKEAGMKRLLASLLCMLILSGCSLKTGIDLMQLPKPNKDRQAITDELERVRSQDAVEDAPYEGENRNTVQMVDLDADGTEEVVAFFRAPANGNTYEALVLSKNADGSYRFVGRVQGTGARIDAVSYPVVTQDGRRCILLTMEKIGEQGNHLIAADYTGDSVQVMLETDYVNILPVDLDNNGAQEIFLITGVEPRRTASIYTYDGAKGTLTLMSESPLSSSAKIIEQANSGYIEDQMPAVFVEETVESGNGQQTDLFVYQPEEGLRNLALNTESGTGRGTYRVVPADAYDINGDGLTEIPRAVHMVGSMKDDVDPVYMLDWYLYNADGEPSYVETTYRNVSQEWDFQISQDWYDAVHAVKGSQDGTDYTTFEIYVPDGQSIPLLTIYYLLGDEDELRQQIEKNSLFALDTTASGIFAAEIPEEASDSSLRLTEDEVRARFSLIAVDWSQPQS